jgi:hypothetical protein
VIRTVLGLNGNDGFAVFSYMLTVKDLLLRLEKMTIRYSDEHFYFIVLDRMSRIFSMFFQVSVE